MSTRYMNLVKREDSEFEDEYDGYVLSEGEVRVIANRNNQCDYYYKGIGNCRDQAIYIF